MLQHYQNSLSMGHLLVGQLVLINSVGLLVSGSSLPEDGDICSAEGLKKYLNESLKNEEVHLVYQHCRGKFLDENKLSVSVKETVDDWIGTDLSKAETNQIFLVYELAITAPKPENVGEQFARDCIRMSKQFQTYRESIEPLTQYIDIKLNSLMTNGIDEIDDQERELFNFVQYSQFCRSLLLKADRRHHDGHDESNSTGQ